MIIGIFTHFFAVVTTLAERQFFRALAKLIGRRAARLSACGIAAIVGKMGYLDEGCSVGADGSLYNVRNPTFFWLSMNLTTLIYVNLNHYLEIWVVDLLVFGHSFTPLNSSTSPCYPFLPLLTRESSTLVRLCGLCERQKYPGFADRIHEGLVDIFGDKGRCASYQSSLNISPFLPHSHFIWSCRPVGYEKAGRSMSGLALFFFLLPGILVRLELLTNILSILQEHCYSSCRRRKWCWECYHRWWASAPSLCLSFSLGTSELQWV